MACRKAIQCQLRVFLASNVREQQNGTDHSGVSPLQSSVFRYMCSRRAPCPRVNGRDRFCVKDEGSPMGHPSLFTPSPLLSKRQLFPWRTVIAAVLDIFERGGDQRLAKELDGCNRSRCFQMCSSAVCEHAVDHLVASGPGEVGLMSTNISMFVAMLWPVVLSPRCVSVLVLALYVIGGVFRRYW